MHLTGGCEDDRRAGLERSIRDRLRQHARLRSLCDRLEAIADGLPILPPRGEINALIAELTTLLEERECDASTGPLPEADDPAATAQALAARIRSQRVTDLVHAQDLGMALAEDDGDMQALGYMLRCFFLGCRRALAFEELAVLHLGAGAPPELERALGAAIAPREGRMD